MTEWGAAAVAVSELGDDDQRRALIDIVGDGDEDGEVLAAVIDALSAVDGQPAN